MNGAILPAGGLWATPRDNAGLPDQAARRTTSRRTCALMADGGPTALARRRDQGRIRLRGCHGRRHLDHGPQPLRTATADGRDGRPSPEERGDQNVPRNLNQARRNTAPRRTDPLGNPVAVLEKRLRHPISVVTTENDSIIIGAQRAGPTAAPRSSSRPAPEPPTGAAISTAGAWPSTCTGSPATAPAASTTPPPPSRKSSTWSSS